MDRLLGIDPGLRFTGWGLIDVEGNHLSYVASGVITINSELTVPKRLDYLYQQLEQLIIDYEPCEAAVEETYVNRNGSATLKLGYARGIALFTPARCGLKVSEYGAKTVKRAVVGTGAATKEQMSVMVTRLLPGVNKITRLDASDALAVAICHAHHRATAHSVAAGIVMA